MVIGFLIILVVVFFCSTCIAGYLALEAQENRNLYYTRWLEANKLLEGADLDAVAEGKPLLPKPKELTAWGALEKKTHTQLTQKRLKAMTDYNRYEVEKARLREGLEPVDTMEGMGDYYTTQMIKLRAKEGWD